MEKFLSVVIVNLNYGRFLERAIKSVIEQDGFDLCELIIIDGGSHDDSVDVIKKYSERISYWVSEPDKGQSDAFNKGFSHAMGKFLTWLNADDIMLPGTVRCLHINSLRHKGCVWFTGNYLQYRMDNQKIIFAPWGPHWVPGFLQTFRYPLVIFGPTSFWARSVWDKVGMMSVGLRYSMDTEYWLRMKRIGCRFRRLNHCCWAFGMHNESKTALYAGRVVSADIKRSWYDELKIVNNSVGYTCSKGLSFIGRVLRLIDFSFAVAIYRRIFIVGRTISIYFE